MKKCILLILFLISGVTIWAQQLIPKIGISVANVSLSSDIKDAIEYEFGLPLYDNIKSKTGFVAGLGVEFSLSKLISIQPELLYHQKGFTVDYSASINGFDLTWEETNTLNYLELPVMIKFNFGKFYASVGPVIGYGLGGSYKYDVKVTDGQFSETNSESGKIKFGDEPDNNSDNQYLDNAFEYGYGIGLGYKLFNKIVLDLRHGFGLSSLQDDEDNFDAKSTNSSIQFTVGIPLGGN